MNQPNGTQLIAAERLRQIQSEGYKDLHDDEHEDGELLRLHRFTVFTWLLQNGISLPAAVLDDRAHPEVGQQTPDQPVKS